MPLKISLSSEELIDFCLVGIVTNPISPYKFVYELNKKLNLNLERQENIDLLKPEQNISEYICYKALDEYERPWTIIRNKSIEIKNLNTLDGFLSFFENIEYILPKQKKYSYLLKVESEIDPTILEQLNSVDSILFAEWIDSKKIKNIHHLIE